MDYKKAIELYLGREVFLYDPETQAGDICLRDDGNGVYIDIWNISDKLNPTIAELEALQPQVEAQDNNARVIAQIIELDGKRSRAFFEPSEKEPGQTWLEYYNQQIAQLRSQLEPISST